MARHKYRLDTTLNTILSQMADLRESALRARKDSPEYLNLEQQWNERLFLVSDVTGVPVEEIVHAFREGTVEDLFDTRDVAPTPQEQNYRPLITVVQLFRVEEQGGIFASPLEVDSQIGELAGDGLVVAHIHLNVEGGLVARTITLVRKDLAAT